MQLQSRLSAKRSNKVFYYVQTVDRPSIGGGRAALGHMLAVPRHGRSCTRHDTDTASMLRVFFPGGFSLKCLPDQAGRNTKGSGGFDRQAGEGALSRSGRQAWNGLQGAGNENKGSVWGAPSGVSRDSETAIREVSEVQQA